MKSVSEHERVEQVAARYREAGYHIDFQPSLASLPAGLGNYRPDFVAKQAAESVLVEVKTTSAPSDFDRYQDLAELVQKTPGWRLDLVIAGGPTKIAGVSDYPLPSPRDILALLQDADALLAAERYTATALVGWSACEGLLRRLAASHGIAEQRAPTAQLLKELVAQGILPREDYERVWSTYKARNALAHGFAVPDAQVIARDVVELARLLQARYSSSTATS
jgi:hypothetical protein